MRIKSIDLVADSQKATSFFMHGTRGENSTDDLIKSVKNIMNREGILILL
ncbi:MAG: hypothetical protein ACOYVK_01585 [Bacillota bacterium]